MRIAASSATVVLLLTLSSLASAATDPDAFVEQMFIEGVPYDEARTLPKGSGARLLARFEKERDPRIAATIAVVLGILQEEEALAPLRSRFGQGDGVLSHEEYGVRTSILYALGYLAHRRPESEAFAFLKKGLQPGHWGTLRITWRAPWHGDTAARDVGLSEVAVMAFALTGTEQAIATLSAAQKAGAQPGKGVSASTLAAAVSEAGAIARLGLSGYYHERVRH